ncbi:Pentatricopeptide repeat-containing protein [Actinidia chinensis var. chinensis]|uniref:Pentatricopeptide repeat-containing protein n=1 Tax=Actinidia chinensis var. chinensis TaxID=1590841 RepID=A0A2R6QSZ2_ACTCC|nr:Pentatricopeptide repeat-containing protein [Actinidia chinensis var. chinensis]
MMLPFRLVLVVLLCRQALTLLCQRRVFAGIRRTLAITNQIHSHMTFGTLYHDDSYHKETPSSNHQEKGKKKKKKNPRACAGGLRGFQEASPLGSRFGAGWATDSPFTEAISTTASTV